MDSFKTFMDIFERAVQERNSDNLWEILNDSKRYFQNIAKDDSEMVLSMLFDNDKGLLHFINKELNRSTSQKGFDKAIKKAFCLIEFVMTQFTDIFEPYILSTKDTCQLALVTQCSEFIRKAACDTLNKLIELFKSYDIKLDETVKKFVDLFPIVKIKEKVLLFSVLGTIIKYNPDNPVVQENSIIIFQRLRNDFSIQVKQAQSNHTFQVYLDVISNILEQLPHDVREEHCQELYEWVKEFSSPTRYTERMVSMRSAVNLLSKHVDIFREFIYRDYKYWNRLLVDLASNKNVQNSECGHRALRNFYRTIGSILKDKTSEDDKAIFLYFKQQFEESLTPNSKISSNMLHFIVYGYSQMASACKTYQTNEDVRNMFSCIANCVMPLCLRDDTENAHLEDICDYQVALSEIILHMPDLSIDQINVITKLNTLLVKRFPDLPITSQNLAISSLINMIISIGVISKSLLDECLYNLIHEGIAWSCSHTLLVDAELQRGLYDLEELPICYKKYVPLWSQLLNPDKYREHTNITQDVVDSTIHASMVLIGKLNLATKMKEDNMFSDAVYSQIAENEADFRTFVNIVDLYVDVINKLKVSSLLLNTIHNFLLKMISMSYKNPLISGFYKLVHATFKHISNLMDEHEIETKTQLMLYKYLMNVLDLIPTFSSELLTTCLHLILDMPITYVKQILNSTIPTFKIAFTVGVSDFELACTALDSLEKWRNHLDNQDMTVFLQEIVPFLEPYLHSGESAVEFLQDIIKTERKVIKQIVLKDEVTLEKFQRRVLLFIASLDTGIITNFMYQRSIETGATWDKKDLLEYTLTLPDTNVICQVNLNFDKILPRLILLAQNSGDRRTKINACEVLHSLTALVLGKTSQRLAFNPDQFVPIYIVLCPALLNLGCDYDETTRKMFQPLVLQLTHWLSSKFMLKSSASTHFIDTLFKGLSNDSNSSLREFSGMCLAEFTKWSIKQSADDGEQLQPNIYEVIYKMTNFALHPSASKRIAAATAFNHLYKILRENTNIVSVYWLEILYSFVRSLDGCNDRSISTALDHVERVVIAKKDLLNERNSHRKATFECESATLLDAVNWLLVQCGCLDQCCRAKSMELVGKLSEHVEDCDSAETMIKNYIDSRGIEAFNGIILSNLERKIESLSVKGLLPLLRSLDCYIWLMRDNLLDAKCLFSNSNSQKEVFFDCASNFVCLINKIKIEEDGDNLVILTKEIEDLQTLQCKTILTTLDFIRILLDSGFQDNFFPDCFFNKDLYEMIAKCIICPHVIGFDAKNLEITEALPKTLDSLLQSITRKPDSLLPRLINSDLSIYVDKHINDFINLDEVISNMSCCSELKEYVRGLTVLEQHNILNKLHNVTELIHRPEDKVTRVFNVLARNYLGELVCLSLNPSVKDYLETLMGFLLMHYEPSITKTLISLIENNTILNTGSGRIEHGIYFLNTFKDEIFRYMLMDTEKTMEMLNELQKNPFFLLTTTEQLLLFVQRHKKQLHRQAEFLANAVIKKFTVFKGAVNDVENGKQKLINIFGIAVHLKREPINVLSMNEDFYTWILCQLLENSDIEHKLYILQNFLVCLTDMTSDTKPELLSILCSLGNNLNVSLDDFSQKNVNALRVINCFQKLVTLLPITKSVATFKSVISFATGIAEHLCNDKTSEYLEKYFASITTDYAFESLQVAYKLFMESKTGTKERFDVLYKFLLPSFGYCKLPEIRRFFEENIKEIHTIICQNLIGTVSYMSQLIASKIGCYDLIAIMFCKVPVNDIDDTESAITRNAIDTVETGRELLQSLYRNTLNVRKLKRPESELKETMRLLHCSAYNCSIAIVSSFKKDQDSYLILFGENREKEQLIWENIVDCEKRYNFQQTVTEFPKYRKKLINIRKSMKQRQVAAPYSYIYSYDLATSTLNEDINAYDFNETTVRSKPITEEESMSLTFESDELNNHECMAPVCGVLTHMISEEICVPNADEDSATIRIPGWLSCFLKSMLRTNYDNVRLFMLKIVLNMQTVFQPYAKFFLKPIMQTTHSYLERNKLNYIIVDVIEMLMNWQTASLEKPSRPIFDARDKSAVQRLWEIIIHQVIVNRSSEITKAIYKYNLNLVKTMLEVWHSYLKLPSNLEEKMSNAHGAAMYLILICFVNGMEKDIIRRDDILRYLDKSVENWKGDEETVLQCYECYGFVLKHLGDDDGSENRKCAIMDKIRSILRQMQLESKDRLMKCIRALCKNYPSAATVTYFEFVVPNIFKVDGQVKSNCLEIFRQCIPDLNAKQIVKELSFMKFHDFLKNRILTYERMALKMIDSLVFVLPASNLSSLITLAIPYAKHEFSEYREVIYSILIKTYKKYATDNSEDEEIRKLMNVSKEILLDGVLDPAEKLQETILNFWTLDAQLKGTCKERLLEILTMYTSRVGQNFLPFLLLLIVDLTKNTNYNEKMFSEPLYDCNYADYEISASWRTRNLGSKTPFFVPSLTSQMNQMFTQTSSALSNVYSDFTYTRPVYEYDAEWQLQETQVPEFEPTYVAENSMTTYENLEQDGIFKVPKVPEPAHNKRSKRFLSSSTDLSRVMRQKQIKKNKRREEMIKEEDARQRSSVKLYRKYRIGDFPDIEILHSALIEPLQQLAKNDQLICKDLIVSIICSLIGDRSFAGKLEGNVKRIVEEEQGINSTIPALLEVLLHSRITICSPEAIVKVSRSNGLNFHGSCVLENNLIYKGDGSEPPNKRMRKENESDSSSDWLLLSNLYESMNDVDVVLSIFQNHISNEDMRTASLAQASNDWKKAKVAYEKAYNTESELIKEHCLQGLFECLSNLCSWNEIDKHVTEKLNGNFDKIWDDPWRDWMFPWLLEVQIYKLLDDDSSDEFFNNVQIMESWLRDDARVKHIKRLYGNELSLFIIESKVESARDFLVNTLDEIREEWIRLHPLSTQLGVRKLQKLRITNDVDRFIKVLKSSTPRNLNGILKFWNNSMPSAQDALVPWDKLTSYRLHFIKTLLRKDEETCNEEDSLQVDTDSYQNIEGNEIIRRMHATAFTMRLKMIEAAFDQGNRYVAKRYGLQLEEIIDSYSIDKIHEFRLICGKIKYLMGETETDATKKLSSYVSSWKYYHKLLRENDLEDTLSVNTRKQISKLSSRIVKLSEDETFAKLLMTNSEILKDINAETNDLSAIRNTLETYSFNHLKTCCNMTTTNKNIGESFFSLAKYCYDRLSRTSSDVQLSKEFVHSILKAMSAGSLEAAHYFPCLLKPEYFNDQETKEIFMNESKHIETWRFLSWQAQLFSHLETSIAPLIIPILKRIVEEYPNAVIYTFRLTVETNPALQEEANTYDIRQLIYNRPEIERFLTAIQYVVQPELYLQHYLLEFRKNLSFGQATAVNMLLEKVYPNARENKHDVKPGAIFSEIQKYKSKIKDLQNSRPKDLERFLDAMLQNIRQSLQKRKDRLKLKDYSPWLCNFPEKDVEIPGQYTGNRKPMPQYHTKIIKFEPTVKVMRSIRKPIRITMIGNDAKEYHFLTKFGEDLRQDQRLQQLFNIMNKTLHADAACKQRQLSVDTYQVIPLSKTVGLIQWIDNTRSLQELLNFNKTKLDESIYKMYEKWMQDAAPNKKPYERYKEAVLKYKAPTVIAKMNEFISKTEWDSLRKTLTVLCPSVESFVTMRRNFITSYATMCIAHWILGIGDRHLENTLVIVDSGRCLGIDFGFAFDAGVNQRIPELMPFRLTPQILGLLKPFTENDLLGMTMIHVLRTLRNDQGPILSCMDVFVHEPLNWTQHVNKGLNESDEDATDIKWVPMRKIQAVTKKLNGIKPSLITIDQLKEQHNDKYFDRYYVIVTGDDEDNKRTRARMENNCLTVAQQVECLLDQATDLNILGRTSAGWKPWL